MALSNDLISQFVKTIQVKDDTKKESTVYGKIVKQGDVEYVQLDGSDLLTPISSTTVVNDGDRVMVTIKNHTAIVTGDFTNPSANNKDVVEIGNKISEFEIIIADKVTTKQLEAEIARIEELRVEDLKAVNAEIETINGKVAKIDTIEADVIEVNKKITAHEGEFTTLRADIADFKDVTAESVKAVEGKFNTLEADYVEFEQTTTNKLEAYEAEIDDLTANVLTADKADLRYANIDFSNIQEAAIEKLFTDSGIIEDLIMSEGKVTGKLVGVTITGDLIEGNTVKADKLVVLGEDGLYYKLNVNSLGEATASSDEKYQNGLDGSVIIANSITAEHIAVDDLVAFGATIGGFHINDHAIYSGAKESVESNNEGVFIGDDGQINIGDTNQYLKYFKDENGNYKLEILADSLMFGTNKTTIEEYIDSKTDIVSTIKDTEGSELNINDGQKIIEFRVEGKSEQETRSGKNKYNYTKVLTDHNGLISTLNDDGSITTTGIPTTNYSVICTETITDKLEDGETYVFSVRQPNSKLIFQLVTKEIDTQTQTYLNTSTESSRSFTVNKSKYTYALTIITTTVTNWGTESLTITNTYQLEKGSTATTFEKYGATPSPDYPSEIVSLGYENLFNANKYGFIGDHNSELISRDTNEVEVSSIGNWSRTISSIMYLKPNTNYVISATVDKSKMSEDTASGFYSADKFQSNGLLTQGVLKGDVYYKFTSNEYGNFPIQFYTNYTGDTITGSVIYTNIQVTEDVIRPYIPYGKTGIEVINKGKNILKPNLKTFAYGGLTGTYDIDTGIYHIRGTTTLEAISVQLIAQAETMPTLKKGVSYTQSVITISGNKNMSIVPSVRNSDGVVTYNYFSDNMTKTPTEDLTINNYNAYFNKGVGVEVDWKFKVQLEEGPTATDFETYRSDSTLLVLDEPLRSLPNETKDIAYIKNHKLYVDRYIKSITLNGSENWILVTGTNNYFTLVIDNVKQTMDEKSDNGVLSNYFKGTRIVGSTANEGISSISNAIRIRHSNITSIDEFKTWLSQNNVQVDYELNEPYTEEMDSIDMKIIDNTVNNYYINESLTTELYCKYYKSGVLIDNTIYDELQNINNNLINNYYTKTEADAQLKITTDSISASVTEIKASQDTIDESLDGINASIEEISKSVSMSITSDDLQIAIKNEMSNGVNNVTTSTGFTFNEAGLTVSKTGKEMSTTIDEDGMTIKRNDEERLIANNEGVIAYDLHARTYLIVGSNSRFEDYEKNGKPQTGCFWIGETSATEAVSEEV